MSQVLIVEDDAELLRALTLKLRTHGMKVAYTPNADACRACGLCVSACPEHAITLGRWPSTSPLTRER